MKHLEELANAKEMGRILGVRPETVLAWHRRGWIPGYRVGRRVRFDASEVIDAIRSARSDQGGDQ